MAGIGKFLGRSFGMWLGKTVQHDINKHKKIEYEYKRKEKANKMIDSAVKIVDTWNSMNDIFIDASRKDLDKIKEIIDNATNTKGRNYKDEEKMKTELKNRIRYNVRKNEEFETIQKFLIDYKENRKNQVQEDKMSVGNKICDDELYGSL